MADLIFLKPRPKKIPPKPQTRDESIIAMREKGFSYVAIGEAFGLSHVRVLQICKKTDD